ncbi:metallophosphatase family protein [Candidatus Woesearchaeota archaeon]|nr:MAG: metallophosphatase family protein [Candidatus Woesearchaeota archaeon]
MKRENVRCDLRDPFVVYSDAHADLGSLARALAKTPMSVRCRICLGDTIGYGKKPAPTLELAKATMDVHLMGNHEYAAIDPEFRNTHMNREARKSVEQHAEEIGPENIEFIKGLEQKLSVGDYFFVHGSLRNPWDYVYFISDAEQMFQDGDFRVAFVGNTHIPTIFELQKDGLVVAREVPENYALAKFELNPRSRYIINVPSVSRPRKGYEKGGFVTVHRNIVNFNWFELG